MAQRVLFVCTGNICRSPLAQGVAEVLAERYAKTRLQFDSAGTGDWHAGERPDARAIELAAKRGYDISGQRARQVTDDDFSLYSYIVAMDNSHKRWLLNARAARSLPEKPVSLLMDWSVGMAGTEIPDPYYSDADAFEAALDLIERGVEGLVRRA